MRTIGAAAVTKTAQSPGGAATAIAQPVWRRDFNKPEHRFSNGCEALSIAVKAANLAAEPANII
jgi:hypothetical protein